LPVRTLLTRGGPIKVGVWRGGVRLGISVPAPFVWRCLSGSAVAPFPHPPSSNRTCRFPASGSQTRPHAFVHGTSCPSRLRRTERCSELIGRPISRSFTTSCACLELRLLPSPGVTRLQRYYKPLRHPMSAQPVPRGRPVGPVIPDLTTLGASRVACAFLVYVLPPLPRCSAWASSSLISPSRISLPRNCSRVGLHIDLFEIP
jgi:hypothetical protein